MGKKSVPVSPVSSLAIGSFPRKIIGLVVVWEGKAPQLSAVYSGKIIFSALFEGLLVSRSGMHAFHPGGDMRPVLADDTPGQ